jgi:hypothetical protein
MLRSTRRVVTVVSLLGLVVQLAAPAARLQHEGGHDRALSLAALADGATPTSLVSASRSGAKHETTCPVCQAAARSKHFAPSLPGTIRASFPRSRSPAHATSAPATKHVAGSQHARAPPALA